MSEALAAAGEVRTGRVRFRGISWLVVFCFLVVAIAVFLGIFGKLIAPHDPRELDLAGINAHPSAAHWLGTDDLGRDVFSRLMVGARAALVGPAIIALGAMVLGTAFGLVAAYRGGSVDGAIMRWVDFMFAIPGLLIIIVVAGAVGGGYWMAVVLLAILVTPTETRIVRGAALEQVPRPYVEAAKTLGVSDRRIMLFHIWPNIAGVVTAQLFLTFAAVMIGLAGLSFLGLGSNPGAPDWGLMLAEGNSLLFANPVAVLAPGVMIVLTATALSLIGDWLYEQISSRGATR